MFLPYRPPRIFPSDTATAIERAAGPLTRVSRAAFIAEAAELMRANGITGEGEIYRILKTLQRKYL